MRSIRVIKDKSGKVIATFEKSVGNGPSVTPALEPGHTMDEIDVADDYMEDIKTFYAKHG